MGGTEAPVRKNWGDGRWQQTEPSAEALENPPSNERGTDNSSASALGSVNKRLGGCENKQNMIP